MSEKKLPLISVVLPLYNAEKFIEAAVRSILDQSFRDLELIVLNDGSKDNSLAVLNAIKDERLIVIDQANMGMGPTINKGIALAKGKYIARQDHDDLSAPERLTKQLAFLEANPAVALVGTAAEIIDENGKATGRFHKHVCSNMEIRATLYFDNPFVHSSVMFRKDAIEKTGTYNVSIPSLLQDFELWFRFSKEFELANLPESLVLYRELLSGMSRTNINYAGVVAGQTWLQLQLLIKDAQLRDFSFFYHRCFDDCGEMNTSAAKKIFEKIIIAFADKNKLSHEEAKKVFSAISNHFKEGCLDHKVYASKGSTLKKIISKTERKIFRPRK
ncbi:MAG: glycosyltransferase [Bacteroidia bacterium]|nr:glycosyltransferase [Bacteroidia bacterium]